MRLAVLIAATVALAGCDRIPGTAAALEREARSGLTNLLFDAEAARFRSLRVVNDPHDGKTERIMCGEVNGKNKFGAYAGFRRFMVAPESEFAMIDPQVVDGPGVDETAAATQAGFNEVWPRCEGHRQF